uniref:Uncharacterized protein n=1 Tax=Rhizophora mucronata TaxID=61149 RepID=A0A2P2QIR7_RHIMU
MDSWVVKYGLSCQSLGEYDSVVKMWLFLSVESVALFADVVRVFRLDEGSVSIVLLIISTLQTNSNNIN